MEKELAVSKTLKIGILCLGFLSLLLISLMLIKFPFDHNAQEDTPSTENAPIGDPGSPDLTTAVDDALEKAEGRWKAFEYIIDHIQVQDDGQMAMVWLAAVDPKSGDLLGREPELALAVLNAQGNWQVFLETEDQFENEFGDFQYAEKSIIGDILTESEALPKSGQVFGGYYLPWAAGLQKRLTWSVAHTSCYPTYYCTHAFDFADGTMFALLASKGGTVFHWKDTCANGDTKCTNSITLQDRSTTPWTYQIYLHLAKDSIPANLKQVGTPVLRGQFIGNVDDTGASTGHHVHIMVVTEETRYQSKNGYVWGVAEDITFRDVRINWDPATQGGRPRLKYEAEDYGGEGQSLYVSGNQPANPPTGALTAPSSKTILTEPSVKLSGWSQDNLGVNKMEFLVNFNGNWLQIHEAPGADNFTIDLDLCTIDFPDGPFKLAFRVWDVEGNPSPILSVRSLIKDVDCGDLTSDPRVRLLTKDGVLALPKSGMLRAEALPGSENHAIDYVEFWLNERDWDQVDWTYLGKDSNGADGWGVPISTSGKNESTNNFLIAVATDKAGNSDADLNFRGMIDHTDPWLDVEWPVSPFKGEVLTFSWSGGDNLSGLDDYFYTVAANLTDGGYDTWEGYLAEYEVSLEIPVEKYQLVVFNLYAQDKSGNVTTRKILAYIDNDDVLLD